MASTWTRRTPPALGRRGTGAWHGRPGTAAEATAMRGQLRAALRDHWLPLRTGQDGAGVLLLVFEELVSNALRHGRPPVEVTVTVAGGGWLLEVCDGAPDRPPVPAVDRDAAQGGMGLKLVARLCEDHGWTLLGDRKLVWAGVDLVAEQVRATTGRARPGRPAGGGIRAADGHGADARGDPGPDGGGRGRGRQTRRRRPAPRRGPARPAGGRAGPPDVTVPAVNPGFRSGPDRTPGTGPGWDSSRPTGSR